MLTQRDWLEPCYSNRLVQPFVRYLSAQRIASNQLGSLLALEADARVPMRTLASLIEDCEPAGASADLGLRVARAMPGPVGGLVHHVASSAERLEQAIVCMTRYARLMHEGAELQLAVQDGVARIGARLPASAEVADFFMVALWRSFVHWTGQELACEAWFRQPEPADLTPYRAVLPGVRLRFDAPCQALGFDAKLLSLPLPRADVDLHTLLVRQADDQLARLPEARSLTKRVRSLLLAQMHEGTADSHRVAAKLGMSRRTLSRYLEQEATSYSEVLHGVRREVAHHLLERTEANMQEIAARLGYCQTAAFSRAFRRWEGTSPLAYRRRVRGYTEDALQPFFERHEELAS
jgi:AraC-like DNA-binding protein